MRTYVVAALVVAVVACLSCGVSAKGYGYGSHGAKYRAYQPPLHGVRYFAQRYRVNPGYSQYVSGYNSGGYYGTGGFNYIWLLAIFLIFFFLLNDK